MTGRQEGRDSQNEAQERRPDKGRNEARQTKNAGAELMKQCRETFTHHRANLSALCSYVADRRSC
jgi:hypothetical protein